MGLILHVGATVWFSDTAALTGAACAILGLAALLRQRLGARAGDVVFEGVVAATAAGFVMWALFTGSVSADSSHLALGALLRFLLSWVVLWLAARLALLTDENPVAYRYLVAAFFCLLSADALAIGTVFGAGGAGQGRFLVLELAAYGLWVVGTVHPSLRPGGLGPVFEQSDGNQRRQLVFSLGLVVLVPAVLVLRVLRGDGLDLPVVLLGSGLLPLLVVVQLFRQVKGRAGAEHRAQHDALTGLPNRTLFNDRVDMALAQAKRTGRGVAVMYLDLDRFKGINDSLGHSVGNEVLKAVARRLAGSVRDSDTVARMGGDEFTLLLPDLACAADAAAVADEVIRAFADPFLAGTQELFTTTSIGVALFPGDGADSETLLMHADTAMYRAKAGGPGRYVIAN